MVPALEYPRDSQLASSSSTLAGLIDISMAMATPPWRVRNRSEPTTCFLVISVRRLAALVSWRSRSFVAHITHSGCPVISVGSGTDDDLFFLGPFAEPRLLLQPVQLLHPARIAYYALCGVQCRVSVLPSSKCMFYIPAPHSVYVRAA